MDARAFGIGWGLWFPVIQFLEMGICAVKRQNNTPTQKHKPFRATANDPPHPSLHYFPSAPSVLYPSSVADLHADAVHVPQFLVRPSALSPIATSTPIHVASSPAVLLYSYTGGEQYIHQARARNVSVYGRPLPRRFDLRMHLARGKGRVIRCASTPWRGSSH